MKRRKFRRIMKALAVFCILMLLCPVVAYNVLAAPTSDDFLLRVEVVNPGKESVKISAPLSLIDSVFDLLPREIRDLSEKVGLRPEEIRKELETVQGQDLVRIEGKEKVRIWLEPVTPENRSDLGFVKVHVREMGEHGEEINVCVPRGLVQLAAGVIKTFGLTDEMVNLPPFLKEIQKRQDCE